MQVFRAIEPEACRRVVSTHDVSGDGSTLSAARFPAFLGTAIVVANSCAPLVVVLAVVLLTQNTCYRRLDIDQGARNNPAGNVLPYIILIAVRLEACESYHVQGACP